MRAESFVTVSIAKGQGGPLKTDRTLLPMHAKYWIASQRGGFVQFPWIMCYY